MTHDPDARRTDELIERPIERFGRAVGWSFAMNAVQLVATLGTTFVLAALLGPRDFGVVALALIFINLLQLVMQGGLTPALIQRPELTLRHLDSAFWLTMVSAVVFAAVSLLSGGWWAGVNDAPDAAPVIRVLTLLILAKGLIVVQDALLRRQLRFRELAVRTTAASVSGAAVGLTWAVVQPSIWAIVAQQLTTEVVGIVVLWSVSDWRPRTRVWRDEAHELVGFASKSTLSSIAVFINNRVDALLVGVFFGARAVGLYRLASRVVESAVELTVQPIQHVALPEFSRHQHRVAGLGVRYRHLVVGSTAIGAPVMATVFATAGPLMAVLGDQWSGAVTALKLLCVVGLVRVMTMLSGPAVQAAGRPGLQAWMTWVAAGLSAAGFWFAGMALSGRSTDSQVIGMAASRGVLYALILLPIVQAWLVARVLKVAPIELARLLAPILGLALGSGLGGWILAIWMADGGIPDIVSLVVVGAVTGGVSVGAILATNSDARRFIEPIWRSVFRKA